MVPELSAILAFTRAGDNWKCRYIYRTDMHVTIHVALWPCKHNIHQGDTALNKEKSWLIIPTTDTNTSLFSCVCLFTVNFQTLVFFFAF